MTQQAELTVSSETTAHSTNDSHAVVIRLIGARLDGTVRTSLHHGFALIAQLRRILGLGDVNHGR
ncbi:hypothetical protein [Synechococcus sp. M16CYN]|uniref:hypothetical protein n=1 Tax=Synechococcus sp. M16CYN TaxID=3103139 RepID=UPI00334268BB